MGHFAIVSANLHLPYLECPWSRGHTEVDELLGLRSWVFQQFPQGELVAREAETSVRYNKVSSAQNRSSYIVRRRSLDIDKKGEELKNEKNVSN